MKVKQSIEQVDPKTLTKDQKDQFTSQIEDEFLKSKDALFQAQFGTLARILNKIIKKKNKRDGTEQALIKNWENLKNYLYMHGNTLLEDSELLGRFAILDKKRLKHKLKDANLESKKDIYEDGLAAIATDRSNRLVALEVKDAVKYYKDKVLPWFNLIKIPGRVALDDMSRIIDEFAAILSQMSPDTIEQDALTTLKKFYADNNMSLNFADFESVEDHIRTKLKDVLESEIRRLDKNASIEDAVNVDLVEEVVVEDDVEHVIQNSNDEIASELKNDSVSELVAESLSEMTSDVASQGTPEVASVRENRVHGLAIVFSQPKSFEITRKDSLKNIERSEDFQNLRKRWANKS